MIIVHVKSDSGIASQNKNCKWFLLTTNVPTSAISSSNWARPKYSRETQKKILWNWWINSITTYSLVEFWQDLLHITSLQWGHSNHEHLDLFLAFLVSSNYKVRVRSESKHWAIMADKSEVYVWLKSLSPGMKLERLSVQFESRGFRSRRSLVYVKSEDLDSFLLSPDKFLLA